MMSISIVTISLAAATLVVFYVYMNARKSNRVEKSPLKLPLIGDLHSSPIERPLINWSAWSKKYGPITVSKLFGIVPIVVLNSYEAVTELLSRRSQWYSNRPSSVSMEMITDAGPGRSKFTLMHDYNDHLKLHHRVLAPSLGASATSRYQPLMELEACQLLCDLVGTLSKSVDNYIVSTKIIYDLLERTQSSVILALHYGLRISKLDEPILQKVINTQGKITYLAANPRLPDIIPFLRHLPTFLSPWQRYADKLYASQIKLNMQLLQHGKDSPGWNATKQAITTAQKHAQPDYPMLDLDLAFTLATSVQGGMETSPRQILWLFIAAIQYPNFLTKAHQVLDEVVGRDRLPKFTDRNALSYIDAVAHELFRWRPIAPGSIPRRADRDDEFGGVKIAKGVTIMANTWAVSRDENIFSPAAGDVQGFVPERWIREGKMRNDLPLPVFGQGRRICQGKRVAVDGAFLNVAHLLWAFDVEPLEGEECDPWAMVVVGFMTQPRALKFRLKPRGSWVDDVVGREWSNTEKRLEKVMGAVEDVEK